MQVAMAWTVATFYKFVSLPDYEALQAPLLKTCQDLGLRGTILLAPEGINSTLAGSSDSLDQFFAELQLDDRFADLEWKLSTAATVPFERMKVKLKREIVTFGRPVNPTEQVGTYVTPEDWNQVISDPEVLLIDTRNDYEVSIGSFQRAVNPQTQSFREFPDYVSHHLDPQQHPKIAMFCTGGIRCEKASAYLLQQGFKEVYHLQGGILKYLEQVPAAESLWQGECFVFDERVAVGHGLTPGRYDLCLGCGHPIDEGDKASPDYEAGICCPHCAADLTPEKRAKQQERQRQRLSQSLNGPLE